MVWGPSINRSARDTVPVTVDTGSRPAHPSTEKFTSPPSGTGETVHVRMSAGLVGSGETVNAMVVGVDGAAGGTMVGAGGVVMGTDGVVVGGGGVGGAVVGGMVVGSVVGVGVVVGGGVVVGVVVGGVVVGGVVVVGVVVVGAVVVGGATVVGVVVGGAVVGGGAPGGASNAERKAVRELGKLPSSRSWLPSEASNSKYEVNATLFCAIHEAISETK
jgi:hypothetical protein